jgi:hypothetical protein
MAEGKWLCAEEVLLQAKNPDSREYPGSGLQTNSCKTHINPSMRMKLPGLNYPLTSEGSTTQHRHTGTNVSAHELLGNKAYGTTAGVLLLLKIFICVSLLTEEFSTLALGL